MPAAWLWIRGKAGQWRYDSARSNQQARKQLPGAETMGRIRIDRLRLHLLTLPISAAQRHWSNVS
jgi:hypothetical protein